VKFTTVTMEPWHYGPPPQVANAQTVNGFLRKK